MSYARTVHFLIAAALKPQALHIPQMLWLSTYIPIQLVTEIGATSQ